MEADAPPTNSTSAEPASEFPLALFATESNSEERLLFDFSTKKIRGITTRLFSDATFVFENGGWLLMVQHNKHGDQQQEEETVYLVHAGTGRRVDLPPFPSIVDGIFVFYVNAHGDPLAVACIETISIIPTIHVACPGDLYWSAHKNMDDYDMQRVRHIPLIVDAALCGKRVVCVDNHGWILIFDILEMAWRKPAPSSPVWSQQDAHFLVAFGEEVALISCCRRRDRFSAFWFSAFKFFKLDVEAMAWSPLEDTELDGFSWFLYRAAPSVRGRKAGGTSTRFPRISGAVQHRLTLKLRGKGRSLI